MKVIKQTQLTGREQDKLVKLINRKATDQEISLAFPKRDLDVGELRNDTEKIKQEIEAIMRDAPIFDPNKRSF